MSVDIIKLLELYESFPCLWDKAHADFKNRVRRERAELELLPRSGLGSVRELRQKIRSVRCTYNQEVAKVRASVRAGLGPDEKYIPRLSWFANADKFLRKNHEALDFELNTTYSAGSEGSSLVEYEHNGDGLEASAQQPSLTINHEQDDSSSNHNDAFRDQPINHTHDPEPSVSRANDSCRPPKRKTMAVDETVNCAVKVLQELSNHRVRNSEFSVFGEHVATQLQQLPMESAVQLQLDIQNLITKARLDALRTAAMTATFTKTNSLSTPLDSEREENDSLQIHFHVGVR